MSMVKNIIESGLKLAWLGPPKCYGLIVLRPLCLGPTPVLPPPPTNYQAGVLPCWVLMPFNPFAYLLKAFQILLPRYILKKVGLTTWSAEAETIRTQ